MRIRISHGDKFFPVTYKMSYFQSFLELGYTIFGLVVSEEHIFIDSSNENQAMSMKTKFFVRSKKTEEFQ